MIYAGDLVNEDDILLQIETDKVTIDVRYTETQSGTIKEFLVSEDDTVTVGQQVCIVDKGNTEGAEQGDTSNASSLGSTPDHNMTLPEIISSMLLEA